MSDTEFLHSAEHIAARTRELLRSHSHAEPIAIAVAFFGSGAEDIVRQAGGQQHLICNLKSGGTNPQVIRMISSYPGVSMRQSDTLHAKVIIASGGAVVSSANLSTNGMALEGSRSQTWDEAGTFLPPVHEQLPAIRQWFAARWTAARSISEADLAAAEEAWARRKPAPADAEEAAAAPEAPGLTPLRTVEFRGRAPMHQVYLRSAAALVALDGCSGQEMAAGAFQFLFTGRAFTYHYSKCRFVLRNGRVCLNSASVGYFIGADASIASMIQPGRLKASSDGAIRAAARWMLCEGPRPSELEGDIQEGRFSL